MSEAPRRARSTAAVSAQQAERDRREQKPTGARARARSRAPTSTPSPRATWTRWPRAGRAGGIDRIAPLEPRPARARRGALLLRPDLHRVPDMRFEVLDVVAARNQAAVRWHATGTFCGGPFQGIEPTGARIELEGIDLLTVEDGLIQHNDAYYDGAQFARAGRAAAARGQRDGAAHDGRVQRAHAPAAAALQAATSSQIADGVWLVQGGFPLKTMNVYLIEDEGQVTVFDAGIRAMTNGHRLARGRGSAASSASCSATATPTTAAPRRGSARRSSAIPTRSRTPRATAASTTSTSPSSTWYARAVMPRLLAQLGRRAGADRGHRDGGRRRSPASRWSTSRATPPGMIGLWRESDRLALVSDTLLHARPADRAQGRAARAAPRPSTRTPSRRARASASWRRWSRPRSGPATPTR